MKLLFLDFETQSDDALNTNPTEVGAFGVTRTKEVRLPDTYMPWEQVSQLIYDPSYPPQTDEIVELTGITDDMLKRYGKPPREVLPSLGDLIAEADYVLAHNRKFDQVVYEATCQRLGIEVKKPKVAWICTIEDVPWAKKYRCKQLAHLAFDHGIQFDRDSLHRALDDVKLLFNLITTCHMTFDQIIEYRNIPWVFIFLNGVAAPWKDGGISNAQAKKLKFGWKKAPGTDGPEFEGRWVKRVKETQVNEEKAKLVGTNFKLTKLVPADETRNEIQNIESGPVPENAPPI